MTDGKPRLSESSKQRRLALSRWENEGGAAARDAQAGSSAAKMRANAAQTSAKSEQIARAPRHSG